MPDIFTNINTAFRRDPTRTLTLRNTFASQMSKRFRKVKGDIRQSIVQNDVFGLKNEALNLVNTIINTPLGKNQFIFERDSAKVTLFLDWLQDQIDNNILEVYTLPQIGQAVEEAWTNFYVRKAYEKGVQRSQTEMRAAGYSVPEGASIAAAMTTPFHVDRVGLLYTRTFTGLKGITEEMSKQISMILAEGMATGEGPLEIARQINDRVDKIGIRRAKMLARTETIRAHHHGMINEMKNWGVAGVRVLAEWSATEDDRVCSICRNLDGKIFTLDRILGMIPAHPLCRCVAVPLDVTDNEKLRQKITVRDEALAQGA